MIKQCEIIDINENIATVRLYKTKKHKGSVPTAKLATAKLKADAHVGDFALADVNTFMYFLSTVGSFAFPFVTSLASYFVTALFTDNIVIMQSVFLISLAATYIIAGYVEKKLLFKKFSVCTVTEIIE